MEFGIGFLRPTVTMAIALLRIAQVLTGSYLFSRIQEVKQYMVLHGITWSTFGMIRSSSIILVSPPSIDFDWKVTVIGTFFSPSAAPSQVWPLNHYQSQTLEGLFELMQLPSRAPNLASNNRDQEHQRVSLGREVPGYHKHRKHTLLLWFVKN